MTRTRSILASAALLAGCTVGPNHAAPQLPTPPAFAEPSTAAPGARIDLARWWTAYRDPELDRLVGIALAEGIDVQLAASRLRQARATVAATRAGQLPQVNASGRAGRTVSYGSRIHLPDGSPLRAPAEQAGLDEDGDGTIQTGSGGRALDSYTVGFDASWELDLFGGGRRGVEAARARAEAAEWNARDTAVSLVAEVANDYLQLRTLQRREGVLRQQIARQDRGIELIRNTARAGLVPEGDFLRQRSELAATQAQLDPLIAQQRSLIHGIAVLIGRAPEALVPELAQPGAQPDAPPAVPPGLPSDLLRRRPDIRAAERQLAAATADIGVAVADLYPRISLTGVAQLISYALQDLATLSTRQVGAAASGQFPVLDFGRRRAQVRVREEQREQAYLRYQQAVLGAFRDVDDALVRVQSEQIRGGVLRSGLADSERSLRAVEARYRTGLVDLSAVLQAQQTVLNAQDQLAQSDGQLRQALASLYKAIGGGWDPDAPAIPPTLETRPER